jgi:4-hydroxybenzoate polyprenyltransferase
VKVGIHSPALFVGDWTIPLCTTTGIGFIALLSYAGFLNGQGFIFYAAVAISSSILFPKLLRTDIDIPNDCKSFFLDTPLVGQVILGGLVLDAVAQRALNGVAL